MDSSATLTTHHHSKPLPKKLDSARKHPLPQPRSPSSCRTTSFSSSSASSFSPYNSSSSLESVLYFAGAGDDDHPCPYSPLRFSGCGVPFSWEHLPGIPKKQQTCFKKKLIHQESSMKLLPLPPPTNNTTTIKPSSHNYNNKKNKSLESIFLIDPFFAAMVECSKGGDDHEEEEEEEDELRSRNSNGISGRGSNNNNNKVSRSMSDRFGFMNLYSSCKNASAISESIISLPSSRRSRSNYQHFSHRRRSL